jgi:hypothetical protein
MAKNRDLAERIGTTINELDIDFSRFTLTGWIVSILSLGLSGGLAYVVCSAMVKRNGIDPAVGMVFFLIMIAVTTVSFLTLRKLAGALGLSVTKPLTKGRNNDL